ncbi:MAG: amidohydrolase family protein, partial [Spirochaetia bacterium]
MKSEILEAVRAGKPLDGEMVIDSHAHLGPNSRNYTPDISPEDVVVNMKRFGIDTACVCSMEPGIFGDPARQNNSVGRAVKEFPESFKGYAVLGMNYREGLLDELIRAEFLGLTLGLKLHVYRQDYDITADYLEPVFRHLNERRALCLHHFFGKPEILEQLLSAYPEITFIEGHFMHTYNHLVKKYDNLYINTCACTELYGIEELVNEIGSERVLYGSDLTAIDPSFGIGPVAFSRIS